MQLREGIIYVNWQVAHPEHNTNINFIIISLACDSLIRYAHNPHVFHAMDYWKRILRGKKDKILTVDYERLLFIDTEGVLPL